jgi:DHA2 family multidrug resistance protein-like MFS transporter
MSDTDGLPPAARRRAFGTIAIAVFIAVLDGSIANIALPSIARDLHATPANAVWVVNAFQLAVTMALLPCSSLGDTYGYRRVYTFGLAIFTAASFACALAPNLPLLTLARVVQGVGAAGIMSVNGALVRFIFPRAQLGRGLGMNAFLVAVASATGPSVAALILSAASWPYLFAVNVPLGIAALSQIRALPRTPTSGHRFDAASALLNAGTFGLFIVALNGFGDGQAPAVSLAMLAAALAIGIVFILRQLKLPAPMLPVDLFRRPIFTLSVITSVSCYAAQSLAFIALPFLFESAGGQTQIGTGLSMTPWPLTVVFVAPLAGRLSDRISAGVLGSIGLAGLTAGLLLVIALSPHASFWNLAWRMALCGAGFGLFQSPNNRLLISSVPRERSGAGSGILSTARLLGQTIGGALVAVAFALTAAAGGDVGQGARVAVTLAAAFSAGAAVVSGLRLVRRAP